MIGRYLVDSGIVAERDEAGLDRRLRHRVRRAMAGDGLTVETLEWFIAAFGIVESDVERLWATYFGGRNEPEVGVAHTVIRERSVAQRQRHRTMALFERYEADASGAIFRRFTTQMILALENDVRSYLFDHEAHVERIVVHAGGSLGPRHVYGEGLHGHEILLDRSLQRMQRTTLEYRTYYRTVAGPPLTEVRRSARGRTENVSFSVRFASERLPARAWWSIWPDQLEGTPLVEIPVQVNASACITRALPYIEQTVVGFHWEW
ncbi:hypothetical protein FXF51_46745 [Nonomuraea sp. PA05]|uniref:hypothetical protein n=1 Tax=Nonomuraea sp. PA05 TaxID=2604466 RepID=UPI0011D96AD9|nr:hypothetical protein [Nonomuraea sp. PA05]TYB54744.1 hypothetical protein FXF51_46745 [Nonomuraea sp. PA05]